MSTEVGEASSAESLAVIYPYTSFPSVAGVPGVAGVTNASSVLNSVPGEPFLLLFFLLLICIYFNVTGNSILY
jgi:hypothetical protein